MKKEKSLKEKIIKEGNNSYTAMLSGRLLKDKRHTSVQFWGKTEKEAREKLNNWIKMKELKEKKCNHNSIAKGSGEENWRCISCGKITSPPPNKVTDIEGKTLYVSEKSEEQIRQEEKQKWLKEKYPMYKWEKGKITKLTEKK